jgi:hypothetical protein
MTNPGEIWRSRVMRQSFATAPRPIPAVRLARWAFFCIKRLRDHRGVLQALRRCCETYSLARGAPRLEFHHALRRHLTIAEISVVKGGDFKKANAYQ